ncbi:MAG: class I SAM-dependent methyltransferase [Gaiellaceae bacterium]
MPNESQVLELDDVKTRQQAVWTSGDYAAVAARIVIIAEELCEAADLRAGARVLDVAAGSGNATLAAARRGCEVVGIDYVPELLERGRLRADAEGLEVEFVAGDAEALQFEDASFDAVMSVLGVMFAPNQEQAAAELLRVCRPGGRIALASWTPDSFIAEMFRTVSAHAPQPPGLKPPALWGTEERLEELLGPGLQTLETRKRQFVFRYRSPDEFARFFARNYGPVTTVAARMDDGGETLVAEIADIAARHNHEEGSLAVPSDYLEALAVRK